MAGAVGGLLKKFGMGIDDLMAGRTAALKYRAGEIARVGGEAGQTLTSAQLAKYKPYMKTGGFGEAFGGTPVTLGGAGAAAKMGRAHAMGSFIWGGTPGTDTAVRGAAAAGAGLLGANIGMRIGSPVMEALLPPYGFMESNTPINPIVY